MVLIVGDNVWCCFQSLGIQDVQIKKYTQKYPENLKELEKNTAYHYRLFSGFRISQEYRHLHLSSIGTL